MVSPAQPRAVHRRTLRTLCTLLTLHPRSNTFWQSWGMPVQVSMTWAWSPLPVAEAWSFQCSKLAISMLLACPLVLRGLFGQTGGAPLGGYRLYMNSGRDAGDLGTSFLYFCTAFSGPHFVGLRWE